MSRTSPSLRVALLAHSTNPRGGVVHALELGNALHDLGHAAAVFAPDPTGLGFFRPTRCQSVGIPASPHAGSLNDLVRRRIAEYITYFEARPDAFDIYHAHDPISGNALTTLAQRGEIPGFIRTVHHLDHFDDPELQDWLDTSIISADTVLCVSQAARDDVRAGYDIDAQPVPNGVDLTRFSPDPQPGEENVRSRHALAGHPLFLAVGGVESRKNTLRIAQAFHQFQLAYPTASLVIVGGVSLLNHDAYQREFHRWVSTSAWRAGGPPRVLGVIDDADIPSLFRLADALVFPSLKEGFGLVVLEAMACGTPVVVPRIAPCTEYIPHVAAAWCDPLDVPSIARAMTTATTPDAINGFRPAGLSLARKWSWNRSALRHAEIYARHRKEPPRARDALSRSLA